MLPVPMAILRTLVGIAVLGGLGGCGPSRKCPAEPFGDPAVRPQITNLDLLQQLDGDPWTLVFATTFIDADGDIGTGHAEFYLNGRKSPIELDMGDSFRQSGLAADVKAGSIAFPLRFSETGGDRRVVLSIQLIDSAGNQSNCFSIDLRFAVTQLTAPLIEAVHCDECS
ncbi:MAG: hypothetical protein R3C68_03320 [Myxococcota bacterium]